MYGYRNHRHTGHNKVADHLSHQHILPLENDADPTYSDSARSLVSFLTSHHQELPETGITPTLKGHVHGDREFTDDSNVEVLFMPLSGVGFDYASRNADIGHFRSRDSGITHTRRHDYTNVPKNVTKMTR